MTNKSHQEVEREKILIYKDVFNVLVEAHKIMTDKCEELTRFIKKISSIDIDSQRVVMTIKCDARNLLEELGIY